MTNDREFSVTRDQTGWHWYRPDGTEIAPRGNNPNQPHTTHNDDNNRD